MTDITTATPAAPVAPAGNFAALLGELEQMTKAMPADGGDETIQAAADDGAGDGKKPGEEEAEDGTTDGGKPMAKSFLITMEDGSQVEAIDGAEMVKSLLARIDATEASTLQALGSAVDLIKRQDTMIKSLGAKVATLSGQGRGRQTVLTIAEKPAPAASVMAKSDPAAITADQFMVKAMAAFEAGKITSLDVSRAESHLNGGKPIPADIVARVLPQ